MNTTMRTVAHTLAILVVGSPLFALAAGTAPTTLVPACEGSSCTWSHLMQLGQNVVSFFLYGLALPLAAIAFAYAGFQLIVNGGSDKARQNAKDAFLYAGIGLVVAFGAWVIVQFIMVVLFKEEFRITG